MTYDSIIEESIARAWECILNNRVRIFRELCEEWGPDCKIAKERLFVEHKEHGWMHCPSKFNEQLLRCVATGVIVDRTFAALNESKQCVQYLDNWLKKFKKNYDNSKFQLFRQGGGLQAPLGSARGVPGYGFIHPNTIDAAVLQRYGVVRPECPFDAMSLLRTLTCC